MAPPELRPLVGEIYQVDLQATCGKDVRVLVICVIDRETLLVLDEHGQDLMIQTRQIRRRCGYLGVAVIRTDGIRPPYFQCWARALDKRCHWSTEPYLLPPHAALSIVKELESDGIPAEMELSDPNDRFGSALRVSDQLGKQPPKRRNKGLRLSGGCLGPSVFQIDPPPSQMDPAGGVR